MAASVHDRRASSTIYDAGNTRDLPGGKCARRAGAEAAIAKSTRHIRSRPDLAVYKEILIQLDHDRGLARAAAFTMASTMTRFWNGREMVFGDGDGDLPSVHRSLDVVADELTHGVTEATAGLAYQGQSGELDEPCRMYSA